jgi:translation initiation factor IF-3
MSKTNTRKHKINGEVRFNQVRLIGDGEPQLMSSLEAYRLAQSLDLDLILINETLSPPIVKIAEYTKFLYAQERAEKERKKATHKTELKEIQLSVNIAENDMNTMSNRAIKFLEKGDKTKVVLTMKGRQNDQPKRGEATMLNFIQKVSGSGSPETEPRLEGNRWIVMIRPKTKSNSN